VIQLPEALKAKVERAAEVRGISLDDFVRELLEMGLRALELDWNHDSLFAHQRVYEGKAPQDFSAHHDDDDLYGEAESASPTAFRLP